MAGGQSEWAGGQIDRWMDGWTEELSGLINLTECRCSEGFTWRTLFALSIQ